MENEKDTNQKDIIKKGQDAVASDTTAVFPGNEISFNKAVSFPLEKGRVISLKAEKLVAATYLIAGLMPETDPLRARVQEASLHLLSETYPVKGHNNAGLLYGLGNSIDLVLGLLSVAVAANLVSVMNYSILRSEYEKLREYIKSLKESGDRVFGADLTFRDGFFSIPAETPAYAGKAVSEGFSYKGQEITDKGQIIKDRPDNTLSFMNKKTLKGQGASGGAHDNAALAKSNRKDQILRIIKKRKTVTIKDISREISGCSEKTIQRELSALVSKSVLKKEGKKRWSRYSLA